MNSDHRRSRGRRRRLATAFLLLAVGACASRPPEGTRQYLDEKSAATVTVAQGSLVFARDRPELAVHARDYLTLVPIDVNRMGTHVIYFYSYVWSTIDERGPRAGIEATSTYEIVADDRRIPLLPVKGTPGDLGLEEPPLRAPSKSARLLIARTDRETLAFLAAADSIRVVELQNGVSERYELWSGNPGSLVALR